MTHSSTAGRWLPVLALIYLAIYFAFYPATYAYRDESNYLGMAYAMRHGTIFLESQQFPMNSIYTPSAGHWVSYFPLGISLLILPLTFFGWKAAFLLGPLFHLLGVFFTARLAKFFQVPVLASAALYLFFPSFIFFSRTLMSDIPAAVFFLGAVYFYFADKSRFACGLFLGAAVLCRYSHAVLGIPLGIAILTDSLRKRDLKPLVFFVAGLLPFAGIILAHNFACYGSFFKTGYSGSVSHHSQFAQAYLGKNLRHYLPGLLLIYPGMLFAFFLSKKLRRPLIWASVFLILTLYSFNMAFDLFPGHPLITTVFGNRYLFPLIPFMILAYAEFSPKIPKVVSCTFLALLIAAAGFVSMKHQAYLQTQWGMTRLIYDHTIEGSVVFYEMNVAELLQGVWGNRRYVRYLDDGHVLQVLKNTDFSRDVYLAKRDLVIHGEMFDRGPEDIPEMNALYDFAKIAEKDGAMVYKITPKKGMLS